MNKSKSCEILHYAIIIDKITGYTFVRRIASGGMADVYHYVQNFPRRDVAIKIWKNHQRDVCELSANLRERKDSVSSVLSSSILDDSFANEVNLIAKLSCHQNIIDIFDIGKTSNGHNYLTMNLCKCDISNRELNYSYDDFKTFCEDIGSALIFAHSQSILHGDIKPNNILISNLFSRQLASQSISSRNNVQGKSFILSDFGTSTQTVLQRGEAATGLTFNYAPPEMIHDGLLLPQSDIYSFAKTIVDIMPLFPIPLDICKRVNSVLQNALKLNYNARPKTINDFVNRMMSSFDN